MKCFQFKIAVIFLVGFGFSGLAIADRGQNGGDGFENSRLVLNAAITELWQNVDNLVDPELTPMRRIILIEALRQVERDELNPRYKDDGTELMFDYSTRSDPDAPKRIIAARLFFWGYMGTGVERYGIDLPGVKRKILIEISHLWKFNNEQADAFANRLIPPSFPLQQVPVVAAPQTQAPPAIPGAETNPQKGRKFFGLYEIPTMARCKDYLTTFFEDQLLITQGEVVYRGCENYFIIEVKEFRKFLAVCQFRSCRLTHPDPTNRCEASVNYVSVGSAGQGKIITEERCEMSR